MDADPNGRIICELSNWTGKAYRIPRGKVKDCADRKELKSTAVYILFGGAVLSSKKPKAYIGEAENVYARLVQHVSEKEFWNEAVVLSRLFELASDAGRYEIQNGNRPTRSSISESDQAEMEEFIEYVRMLINTLNFKVFEPLVKESTSIESNSEELYLKGVRGAAGRGKRVVDGFVVFKDSEAASVSVPSFPKSFSSLKDELIENEVIKEEQGKFIFVTDYLFSSPSAAASVIMGRSANGMSEWKDKSEKTLKNIESGEIEKANKAINSDS